MEPVKKPYNLIRAFNTVVWALCVVAILALVAGYCIGRKVGANVGAGDLAQAKKQFDEEMTKLKKENYRLETLDSSKSWTIQLYQSNMEGMKLRENDLKQQLSAANANTQKFKVQYEKLNRYDSFAVADIQRYFADSLETARP